MGNIVAARGYFSSPGARPIDCTVRLSLHGYGLHENLTVDGVGAYRVTVPLRPLEELARQTRRQAAGKTGAVERSIRLEGSDETLRAVLVIAWLRIRNGFEMLTLEQGRRGQLSLPYKTVQALVQRERSTQA